MTAKSDLNKVNPAKKLPFQFKDYVEQDSSDLNIGDTSELLTTKPLINFKHKIIN